MLQKYSYLASRDAGLEVVLLLGGRQQLQAFILLILHILTYLGF